MVKNEKVLYVLVILTYKSFFANDFYLIYFKDKKGTQYTLGNPNSFLSEKSIDRRRKQKIVIDSSDLPVSSFYVNQIKNLGYEIHGISKWLNAVLVRVPPGFVPNVDEFFVKHIRPVKRYSTHQRLEVNLNTTSSPKQEVLDYGNSKIQLEMLGVDWLHKKGFYGNGLTIAVLDAGFYKYCEIEAFRHLIENGKILDTYDFYTKSKDVCSINVTHGTSVLSVMAAKLDGQLVGVSHQANYVLYRTEVAEFEYPVEEVFWVLAAERADSMGVDLINSSLGYTDFDNPEFNYTYQSLNGKTSIVSFGALMAARKGILVCNSAGNYGLQPWKYINTPADTDSILACGSVDINRNKSTFSSFGPTADGRIKPDVMAMGQGVYYATVNGGVGIASGTSFASPLICGLAACLWEENPTMSAQELILAIKKSSTNALEPNNEIGWGIPRYQCFIGKENVNQFEAGRIHLFPNPVKSGETLYLKSDLDLAKKLFTIYDFTGKISYQSHFKRFSENCYTVAEIMNLSAGIYYLKTEFNFFKKLIVY